MKYKKLYIAGMLLLSSGIGFTACDDFLKEKPESFIGPDQIGDSDDAIDTWVTGVYSKWIYDMFCWDNFPRLLDMDCDYVSGPDWLFGKFGAGNYQGDESVLNTMWNGCYSIIDRSNLAIKYISAMSSCTESKRQNALGELYFQKAFCYFLLVRAYGAVPIFDKCISDGADQNQPRQSISTVYNEIIGLLTQASSMMYKVDDPRFVKGHVCAGTAAGLLAKVYATMASASMPAGEQMIVKTGAPYGYNAKGDKFNTLPVAKTLTKTQVAGYENFNTDSCYINAAKWAKAVMDGSYGPYSLLPYDQLWTKAHRNDPEFMFSLQAVSGDATYKNGIHTYYSGVLKDDYISTGLWVGNTTHWYDLFDSQDARIVYGVKHRWIVSYQVEGNAGFYFPHNDEWRLKATGYDSNGNKVSDPVAPFNDGRNYWTNTGAECLAWTTKYDDVSDNTITNADAQWPFLRYADVILIYAEAENELGHMSQAIAAMNLVRKRANATLATMSGLGALTTKLAARSAIFEERAKELALEGDRRWDLIRWGIYLQAMNAIDGGYDEGGVNKIRTEKHLLFPLPTAEVNTNKAITSNNPGWN